MATIDLNIALSEAKQNNSIAFTEFQISTAEHVTALNLMLYKIYLSATLRR